MSLTSKSSKSSKSSPAATAPRWLSYLDRTFKKLRVPVEELTCGSGLLRIVMGGDGQSQLVATVRPRAEGRHGWSETTRFVIGYDGAGELARGQERHMRIIDKVLRHIEAKIPRDLSETGALFTREVHPEEKFRRSFPFCDLERSDIGGKEEVEVLLRATANCNQDCPFCSALERATPSPELLATCIEEAGRTFPGCMLSITGGEPTLRASFVGEVDLALACEGVGRLQVQTNAVGFARKIDPTRWPVSNRLSFFTSLHALNEAIYDRCTGTTGQFELGKQGIARIIAAGHSVTVNCVVNSINLEHLESYVRDLPEALPWRANAVLHFSVLICPEYRPGAADFLVRYRELAPRLEAAAAQAKKLGLPMDPLRSSTHAAIPACIFNETHRNHDPHRPFVQPGETGYQGEPARPWIKATRCKDCVEDRWCLGVPGAYAEKFGLDELTPL